MNIRPYSASDWNRVCEIHDAARRDELAAIKSFRNVPDVQLIEIGELNAYDVLCNDWIVFTASTLPAGEAGEVEIAAAKPKKAAAKKAAAKKAAAAEAESESGSDDDAEAAPKKAAAKKAAPKKAAAESAEPEAEEEAES